MGSYMPPPDSPVRLKGVGDSLWITIDASLPVAQLKEELCKPFERLRHLAVNARIILDPGETLLEDSLLEDLGAFLQERFQVGRVARPPEPKDRPKAGTTAHPHAIKANAWVHQAEDSLVIAGRVRSGQKVEARKHLVILGDLNPGAEAIAGGDIIVLGTLMGTAAAGQPDNESAIVMALDFRPTQIQIGAYVGAGKSSCAGKNPEFAYLDNSQFVVADYTGDNPFKRLARPEVR